MPEPTTTQFPRGNNRTFKAEYLVRKNDDGSDTFAILSVSHNSTRKAMTALLYRCEREYDNGYTVDKSTVYGGTRIRLDSLPMARYTEKAAEAFFDRLVADLRDSDLPIFTDVSLPA